jgi:hypothetical protein
MDYFVCPLCNRNHKKDYMTYHHLYPSLNGSKKGNEVIYVCRTCHNVIHYCHTNAELRLYFNTLEKIKKSLLINDMLELYKYKADNCIFTIKKLKRRLKYVA